MVPTLKHRIARAIWRWLPVISIAIAMILMLLPKPGFSHSANGIMPLLPLACLWFWVVRHPRMLHPVPIMLLGVVYDSMSHAPLGLHSLLWLLPLLFLKRIRKLLKNEGFLVAYLLFGGLLVIVLFAQWLLADYLANIQYPLAPLVLQWFTSMLFYPLVHSILHLLERSMHRRYWFVLKSV